MLRLQRLGIRTRVTTIGALAVLLALSLAALALVTVLDRQTTSTIRQSARQSARDLAAELATDDKDAFAATIGARPGGAAVVQVLDGRGEVVAASPAIEGQPPIAAASPGATTTESRLPFAGNDEYVVATQATTVAGQPYTVVVARSLESAEAVVRTVAVSMAIAVPVLSCLVGFVIWLAVGSSLGSVEGIRRQVESITSKDLHQRVPVPVPDDEIRQLADTMNSMLERLDTSAATQRQFVSDVSHELKSPLASITAMLDVNGDPVDPALRQEVSRMASLVADLLLLARSDEGGLTLRIAEVDLDDLAAAEASRLRSQTNLRVDTDIEAVRVMGDPARLAQVLRNLTDNAARFASDAVVIGVRAGHGWAHVSVADDGPGIAQADRQRVLRRFARLDEHRSRGSGGAGLGLAICDELARLHGGRVVVEDSALGGVQLRLELPLESST